MRERIILFPGSMRDLTDHTGKKYVSVNDGSGFPLILISGIGHRDFLNAEVDLTMEVRKAEEDYGRIDALVHVETLPVYRDTGESGVFYPYFCSRGYAVREVEDGSNGGERE